MDSGQFVAWLEKKLTAAGVRKVVPDLTTLEAAWQRAYQLAGLLRRLKHFDSGEQEPQRVAPDDLSTRITEAIEGGTQSWDAAIWQLAQEIDPSELGAGS